METQQTNLKPIERQYQGRYLCPDCSNILSVTREPAKIIQYCNRCPWKQVRHLTPVEKGVYETKDTEKKPDEAVTDFYEA